MPRTSLLALVLSLTFVATGCMHAQTRSPGSSASASSTIILTSGDQQVERDRHERMAIQRDERDRVAQRDGEDPRAVMPEPVTLQDVEITRRVREAVAADASLSDAARNVTISTSSAVVSLRGDVTSSAERNALDRHAYEVVGGSRVDNMLSVSAPDVP